MGKKADMRDVLMRSARASHAVGVLCPDETALRFELAGDGACLAVADGVVRIGEDGRGDGPLVFVPDSLIADDPGQVDAVKRGLREEQCWTCQQVPLGRLGTRLPIAALQMDAQSDFILV